MGKRIVIAGDVHAPYHSHAGIKLFRKVVNQAEATEIGQIGDFLDCYAISRYPKPPSRKVNAQEELDEGLVVTKYVRESRDVPAWVTLGNHEDRWEKELGGALKHLGRPRSLDIPTQLRSQGWQVSSYGDYRQLAPELIACHDFGRSGKTAMLYGANDLGTSVVYGHTHALGCFYQPTMARNTHLCINTGWLGEVSWIDYKFRASAARNSMLGAVLVEISHSGLFNAVPIPFITVGTKLRACVYGTWLAVHI